MRKFMEEAEESTFQFNRASEIRNFILSRAARVFTFTNWPNQAARNEVASIPHYWRSGVDFRPIDLSVMQRSHLIELGFQQRSEESMALLIPLWLFPFIKHNTVAYDIYGNLVLDTQDMHIPELVGECIPYGVVPADSKSGFVLVSD